MVIRRQRARNRGGAEDEEEVEIFYVHKNTGEKLWGSSPPAEEAHLYELWEFDPCTGEVSSPSTTTEKAEEEEEADEAGATQAEEEQAAAAAAVAAAAAAAAAANKAEEQETAAAAVAEAAPPPAAALAAASNEESVLPRQPPPQPEQEQALELEIEATVPAHASKARPRHTRSIPRWVMDEETDSCMGCTAEFNFWTRRHHCRYCGALVCGDCLAQGQIHSDRWVSEEDGRSLVHNAGPGGFTQAIQVCTTCSKLAPAEVRLRAVDANEQQRLAAARERAAKDAAMLDRDQLNAVKIEELTQKAELAGISKARVGKAQVMSSPRRALVSLVIEANLLKSPLTTDEIRTPR